MSRRKTTSERKLDRKAIKAESGFNPKGVSARTENQKTLIQSILSNDIVLCYGPAGTGKTHVATGVAAHLLRKSLIEKIVLTRPVVEAGNSIGYLPGTMEEKVGPYLIPLFDEIGKYIERNKLKALMAEKVIEIAPLSMMRGRTFLNSVVICDESQNGNMEELKMLLTRIGMNTKLLVLGDLEQSDLQPHCRGAFQRCLDRLTGIDGIGVVELTADDIVRHHLIRIIKERLG